MPFKISEMAEENINQSLEPRIEPLQAQVHFDEPEPEKSKASIWTLIIGLVLIVRGIMRYNEGGGIEIFGVIMFAIGLGSLYVYFKDRF